MVRRILLVIALLGLMFAAVSCQTVKGVGQDIKNVGEAGERAVK
jgi:predicted small secreted protein